MDNIDGYITKDDVYRLLSDFRIYIPTDIRHQMTEKVKALPSVDVGSGEHNKESLKWPSQQLFSDGFGGARVGYACPYCKQYVPYAGKYCGKCGKRVYGGEDDE